MRRGARLPLRAAIEDLLRRFIAVRHAEFVERKQREAGGQPDSQVGQTQTPHTHAGRANGGDFVVARMIGQRIEQRQQQPHRQDYHKKLGCSDQVQFRNISRVQFALLEFA